MKPKYSHVTVQFGGFIANQGETQDIAVQDIIGDQYTVTDRDSSNGMVGVGYFFNGIDKDRYSIDYGLNTFYLGQGQLNARTDQVLNSLDTGNAYVV